MNLLQKVPLHLSFYIFIRWLRILKDAFSKYQMNVMSFLCYLLQSSLNALPLPPFMFCGSCIRGRNFDERSFKWCAMCDFRVTQWGTSAYEMMTTLKPNQKSRGGKADIVAVRYFPFVIVATERRRRLYHETTDNDMVPIQRVMNCTFK